MPRRSCSALAAPPSCVNLPVERRGSRKAAPSGRSNTKTLAFRPPDYSKTLVILTEKKTRKNFMHFSALLALASFSKVTSGGDSCSLMKIGVKTSAFLFVFLHHVIRR